MLTQYKDKIIETWSRKSKGRSPSAELRSSFNAGELIPDFLEGALVALKSDFREIDSQRKIPPVSLSKEFPIEQVIHEFGSLRESIFEVFEAEGVDLGYKEVRRLNKYIDDEIAGVAARFAKMRDDELVQSNDHLHEFTYIASHDLKEPLRTIAGYTDLLEKKQKSKWDQDSLTFLNYIRGGAIRLQKLIDDLSVYGQVGASEGERTTFKAEDAITAAIDSLSDAISSSKTRILRTGFFPSVFGDFNQITRVFCNLIDNAVKFRNKNCDSFVEISCQRVGDEHLFSIRDNGIGIKPKEAKCLFKLFKRLHSYEEYPGTGLGLALCKKIVEMYHGRIWVESEPGRGSVFSFTLPVISH